MSEPPPPERPADPARVRREDIGPPGRDWQLALGCSALVAMAIVAFYLWRC